MAVSIPRDKPVVDVETLKRLPGTGSARLDSIDARARRVSGLLLFNDDLQGLPSVASHVGTMARPAPHPT